VEGVRLRPRGRPEKGCGISPINAQGLFHGPQKMDEMSEAYSLISTKMVSKGRMFFSSVQVAEKRKGSQQSFVG